MNLRDLQYLVAVADYKHFGMAAQACFVSQPTLSAQLKKLEDELGVALIERTNKKVFITPIGETIIKQAREVLREIKIIKETSQLARDPYAGKFTLGVIPTLAPYLLPHVMSEFKQHLPLLEIYLIEEKTSTLLEQLAKGSIDAAILATPAEAHNFEEQVVFSEAFYLAVTDTNPLADKKSIVLQDLRSENLMLLADGHCMREQALEVCKLAHVQTRSDFSATSLETLTLMVAAGNGVTLIPALATSNSHQYPHLRLIPFADNIPTRQIALCWRNKSPRKLCCLKLAEITEDKIRKVLQNL